MIFTNFSFFLFLILFTGCYSLVPQKIQKYILLAGNLLFCYFAGWKSFLIALLIVVLTYCFSFAKRKIVIAGIILNILILIYFKYLSDFYPIGISFYIFTSIAYLADIYLNKIKPEKDILNYANFILFFPKFISGPVERADKLLPQLNENVKHTVTFDNLQLGFNLFLFGFFKKICIANRLQIYVDKIFDNLSCFGGLSLVIAVAFYSIQIYCDFSGYTDMALGVAKIFGFNITQNFKNPYSAVSVGDFWHKWHISLSTWLRDYVYIPLGGNRKGLLRKYLNILITFLVSGIWHGNTLNFCIWGGVHAFMQIFENLLKKPISSLHLKVRNIITVILIAFAWIFFRINTISDIPIFFSNLISKDYFNINSCIIALSGINFSTFNNMTPSLLLNINVFVCLILLIVTSKIEISKGLHISEIIVQKKLKIRYLFDYALILLIFLTGVFDSTRFIYAAF